MARTRSITSIEAEISKVSSELKQAQEKADALSQRLMELQQMREAYESKQVMEAFRKSGKSLQELLTFLDV
ncbi:hypothetical protein [Mediterraneibacter gnavus]|uniref:hypothetical protein n=1 Tax=Mediterraneibacter gnavus TaxID=33038 RepID=UPI001570A740|nr:hypothetical protein [Mediterraneibacter gnavus]MCB5666335.1 hypothetical protein [Mediterraneibacter gnavus]MCB5683382.1 hypothetical protein [Mediterraneibacter gnavus]NSH70592.1 hypothetical protein [Mediterraneibacter gnavus]NSH84509.1 hypothetical protein [Mediterraneibacter gnavus]NSH88175.1 hypothetical protein [Mediterraneibacter gnavus]